MRIETNLRLIGLFTICTSALFHVPILVPYYMDEIGLGYREFLYGEAAWAAAIVLCDVPTGWVSDVGRRKLTLALGALCSMVGYGCLIFADSFLDIILIQVLLGMGLSLLSGSETAMLYDSLLSVNREKEYARLEGKRQALSFYGIAVASAVGGILYSVDHHLPLWFNIAVEGTALIAALAMYEPERHKRSSKKHPIADILSTMKFALHGHAEIAFIILFSAVMFCATQLIMWSQQPYYLALDVPKWVFGLLIATGFALGGISSHIAHKFEGKMSIYRTLLIGWAVVLSTALIAAVHLGWSGIVVLMIGGSCVFGSISPRVNEAINRTVGSERRATILSTQSFVTFLLFALISGITGWIAGRWGIQASLYAIAAWCVMAGLCLAALGRRGRKNV